MSAFELLSKIVKISAKQNCGHLIGAVFSCMMYAILSVLVIVSSQLFFDKSSYVSIEEGGFLLLFLCLSIVGSQCSMTLNNYFFDAFLYDVKGTINMIINEHISEIPSEEFEDPNILDLINKGKKGVEGYLILFSVLHMVCFFYVPYFVLLEIYLHQLDNSLIWIILIIALPEIISQILKIRIFEELENRSVSLRRENEEIQNLIVGREFFKETRSYNAVDFILKKLKDNIRKLDKIQTDAERKSTFREMELKMLTIGGYILAFIVLLDSVLEGKISVGAFAAVFNSLIMIEIYIEEIIGFHFSRITKNISGIKNVNILVNYKARKRNFKTIENKEIILSNLSYSYSGSPQKALNQINLNINLGETTAIVGYNGAGKTTLSKIILGLYEPSEGIISYSSQLVENKKIEETATFQNFQKYKMTIRENVLISSHFMEKNFSLKELLREVEMNLDCYEKSENTMLATEFGGIDISGGNWQRIALARGINKSHKLIVLDEPTASIDPLEESKIYEEIRKIGKRVTTIIVTHRIGAARLANRIIVMAEGNIVEQGTHEELMKKEGLYYKMFYEQAKWYEK